MSGKKSQKGTVAVQSIRDRLRLRWSYQGQRYHLSLELPDSITNRKVAEAKARLIESHMATGTFDTTLVSYRLETSTQQSLTVVDLFEKYSAFKYKDLLPQSIAKYEGLKGYLQQYFRSKTASQLSEPEAEKFKNWLAEKVAPVTLKERIGLLSSCWRWAERKKWVTSNPWLDVRVKVPKKRPDAFTQEEVQKILQGFREQAPHYADYVEFCLSVGCRLGEAIALRWKHLSNDCSVVWISEAYYRGTFGSTKTGDDRYFELSPRLQRMLQARKGDAKPEDLVFQSPKGHPIDDHNFRNRYWKPILEAVGVRYRKPRNVRQTFASHALDQGRSPGEVSAITGHSVETLYRNYAGNVKSRPKVPDLFGED